MQIFKDPGELWKEQDQTWYTKAVSYWDNQEQSYNGGTAMHDNLFLAL